MNRRSLSHRIVVLAWVTAVVALDLAATPPAVPIPPLNQKVLEFTRERLGEKVDDGQCISLAVEALRYAGAKRYPFDPSGDYVWGQPVASFKEALPGDILQFRNAVFQGKRWISKQRWVSWHQEYPHHTAIVSEVSEGGRVVAILHQNVGAPDADAKTKQVVQEASIRPESLQGSGAVAIFRPIARDEAENPKIRHEVPVARRTDVTIRGDSFLINGRPTYEGRSWKGRSIEGLLFNARMVQGVFDDLNPATRSRWAYPDTKWWDPERNSREFLAAMPLCATTACLASPSTCKAVARKATRRAGRSGTTRPSPPRATPVQNTSTGSPASSTAPTGWGWPSSSASLTSARTSG